MCLLSERLFYVIFDIFNYNISTNMSVSSKVEHAKI